MNGVLVSHPHAASFSVGVAAALARAGRLSLFATGVAVGDTGLGRSAGEHLARRWSVLHNRLLNGVPSNRIRSLAAVELGSRAAGRLLTALRARTKTYDVLFPAHDYAVAALPWPADVGAVYAYEDAALRTFGKARRRGLERIWDLPLPHYLTIEDMWREEATRWPEAVQGERPREPDWKRRRKDAELGLATRVIAASGFTKQSLESKVTAPVSIVPYGFPIDTFELRQRPPSGPFRVVSVGSHDLRKGTPYLLEAWRRAAIPGGELHLVGPMRLAKAFLDRYAGMFRHWPHVPKSSLAEHYSAADVLAFPTVGDGFGLVMQESMCCGTPVVTTPCGGGPECITDGENGWLVPPRDIDALVERFRSAAADRDKAFSVGRAARARAERWTWADSGDALVQALES